MAILPGAMPVPRRASALVALLLAGGLLVAGCGSSGSDTTTGAVGTTGVAATTGASGCSTAEPAGNPDRKSYDSPPPMTIDANKTYRATMKTSCGTIVIALDAKAAPKTVNNFVFLSRERFYDGLTFHRVVPGFVIQGGDPKGDGTGGPGYEFPDELPDDGYPPGSVAMANSGPNTNGSQFFIVTGDASNLPNAYSRFGEVVQGLDVARRIEGLANPNADPSDPRAQEPTQKVYIDSVTISEQG